MLSRQRRVTVETALVLSQLIVVSTMPAGACTGEAACERLSLDWGCVSYSPDNPPREMEPVSVYICHKPTFQEHYQAWMRSRA
jgi:hypothetical protein